ncbi:MAG: hypothetical protein WBD47_00065, partial [Phormidesmis sp.]
PEFMAALQTMETPKPVFDLSSWTQDVPSQEIEEVKETAVSAQVMRPETASEPLITPTKVKAA